VDAMDRRDHEETTVKLAGHASVEGRNDDDDDAAPAVGEEEVVVAGNT
jgi:hypothetical protein